MNTLALGSIESPVTSPVASTAPARRWSRRVAMDIVGMLDVATVVAGAILPAWIYAAVGGLEINTVMIVKSALVTALLFFVCMQAWNMYDTSRLNDLPVYPTRLLAALMLATFAALGIGVPFSVAEVHLWVWYAAWISASFVAILGSRLICRAVLSQMTRAGRFDTRVAVFGAGEIARRVQDDLKAQTKGIHFVGVYDDRPRDRLDADNLSIKGRLEDLMEAGRKGAIDQIVIALPQSADRRMSMIAAKLQQLPVSIHMVTHISSDLVESGPAHKVSSVGGVGLLDVKEKPLTDWAPLVKRVEDIVLGGLLLAIALPVMAVIAAVIKFDSRGPVLVRQRRRGLNLAVIDMFKFRTTAEAEEGNTDEPGMTMVGRCLQRFGLDALPQLINVLRGEMSLVGPQPHALAHDEQWGDQVKTYGMRHQMKPGMTGLAQVEGWSAQITSENDMDARVREDMAYIRNWSVGLDFKVLARSIAAAIFAKRAH